SPVCPSPRSGYAPVSWRTLGHTPKAEVGTPPERRGCTPPPPVRRSVVASDRGAGPRGGVVAGDARRARPDRAPAGRAGLLLGTHRRVGPDGCPRRRRLRR